MTAPEPAAAVWPSLTRRVFLDARVLTFVFAYLYAAYSWLQVAGYHSAFPTLLDRLAFARAFAGNAAIRLFFGYPYDVITVGGYSAWRVGGTLALAGAAFGVLAAVRAFRGEEDAGRTEVVLAGAVGRTTLFGGVLGAVGAGTAVLWVAEAGGLLVGGLPAGGAAYIALATASVVPVFAGVGAVASQLAPTRRGALALSGAVAVASWLLRVVGDTAPGASGLRWASPLGWAELLRPFAGARPAVLLLPAVTAGVLLTLAGFLSFRRDVGTGILPTRDSGPASRVLLSSPTARALRGERLNLGSWALGLAVFGLVLGAISTSVTAAGIPVRLQRQLEKFGGGSIISPRGYLAFVFLLFVLALCLFVCGQVGAARSEEASRQLETLLALPTTRAGWLAGRLALAAGSAAGLAAVAGVATWVGAAAQGVGVGLPAMLEAAANCLPAALLFLGLAALAYAAAPRASAAVSYGLVAAAFLWYLVGSLLGVPTWLVDATPFEHIGLVPTESFRVTAAVAMSGTGLVAAGAAVAVFVRRDLREA